MKTDKQESTKQPKTEQFDIMFGVRKKGLSAIELSTFENGTWSVVTEDIYRIAEQKMRDLLYLGIFQPKSENK